MLRARWSLLSLAGPHARPELKHELRPIRHIRSYTACCDELGLEASSIMEPEDVRTKNSARVIAAMKALIARAGTCTVRIYKWRMRWRQQRLRHYIVDNHHHVSYNNDNHHRVSYLMPSLCGLPRTGRSTTRTAQPAAFSPVAASAHKRGYRINASSPPPKTPGGANMAARMLSQARVLPPVVPPPSDFKQSGFFGLMSKAEAEDALTKANAVITTLQQVCVCVYCQQC